MALDKRTRRLKVKARIRKKVSGTSEKPRIAVYRSNKHIYVQVINDLEGKVLVSASTLCNEVSEKIQDLNKVQQSELVGKVLAEKALNANVKTAVFDRGGYKYHGRVKALADSIRKGGVIF